MENATKALIMAATILISVVIMSLGTYLFVSFSNYSSEVDEEVRTNQIAQFNSQFLKYQGREVTIYDILTVANLAKENNDNYELTVSDANENTLYITIDVLNINHHFENETNTFLKDKSKMQSQIIDNGDNKGELKKYICTDVHVSNVTRRVYKLIFKNIE